MYTITITLRDTCCTAALSDPVPVTTGCRGQFQAVLDADASWEGLQKTVIFYGGARSCAVLLDQENCCLVPPEVLTAPGAMLTVGVQGTAGAAVRCSTLAPVVGLTPGAYLPAEEDPTAQPNLYSQLLAAMESIKALAGAVTSVNGATGAVRLDAASVGARPSSWTPTAQEIGARPNTWTPTAAEVGALPADTVLPKGLPEVTVSDAGKFLRVSGGGIWHAETLSAAEGGSY